MNRASVCCQLECYCGQWDGDAMIMPIAVTNTMAMTMMLAMAITMAMIMVNNTRQRRMTMNKKVYQRDHN